MRALPDGGALILLYRDMPETSRAKRTKAFRQQYETNRKIILATQTLCAICGKPVDKTLKSPDPMSASVDHIIPIAKGGHPCDLSNLQLAHRACNRAKGTDVVAKNIEKAALPNRDFPQSRDWKKD